MTQAIFWIYSTISWIVFVNQKIELKSVILRCETSMKTCYPGHTDWNTTKYDENQINAYILSLFKGEYEIYHTLVGNFIIKEQFRWLNENLKSRTRRSIFYFLFLPLREKYGKTKTLVFKSFV